MSLTADNRASLLEGFLLSAFTPLEWARILQDYYHSVDLAHSLSTEWAPARYFAEAAALLARHGLIDEALFGVLARVRPNRRRELAELLLGTIESPFGSTQATVSEVAAHLAKGTEVPSDRGGTSARPQKSQALILLKLEGTLRDLDPTLLTQLAELLAPHMEDMRLEIHKTTEGSIHLLVTSSRQAMLWLQDRLERGIRTIVAGHELVGIHPSAWSETRSPWQLDPNAESAIAIPTALLSPDERGHLLQAYADRRLRVARGGARGRLPFRHASAQRSELSGTTLTRADLRFSDLSHSRCLNTDFSDALLSGCSFAGANLEGSRLGGVFAVGSDFRHARLHEASLYESDLTGVDMSSALLTRSALVQVSLRRAIFQGADLSDSLVAGADLRGADFTEARLRTTRFQDIIHDEETIWPSGFEPPPSGGRHELSELKFRRVI